MYGYILCNNKQELNLSATDAVYEMHENFIIFNEGYSVNVPKK